MKDEKTTLSDRIKGNTVLIDQKTKLIDENYMLQKRKAKDLAALEKVTSTVFQFTFSIYTNAPISRH